jgi:hypothetical protein
LGEFAFGHVMAMSADEVGFALMAGLIRQLVVGLVCEQHIHENMKDELAEDEMAKMGRASSSGSSQLSSD